MDQFEFIEIHESKKEKLYKAKENACNFTRLNDGNNRIITALNYFLIKEDFYPTNIHLVMKHINIYIPKYVHIYIHMYT